jgi:hypothetical protein
MARSRLLAVTAPISFEQFRKEDQMSQMDVHIASASLDGNILTLDFSVSGNIPGNGAEIYAILADDETSSNVLRGDLLDWRAV